ncbi:glycosyl transferase [Clostridium perfringens]
MINKKIHYCWFGKNEKSKEIKEYIDSWKLYLSDYEIKEWNEENFDIESNEYVKQAYNEKKWAFVTDYVRLYALYTEGGIYMDTDVEVIKNLDIFLNNKAFSGFEDNNYIPTGIMGAEKGNSWIKILLDYYEDKSFYNKDGSLNLTTNVITITNISKKLGLNLNGEQQTFFDGVVMYPKDFFAPKSHLTNKINITSNTYCIHHFNGSWLNKGIKDKLRPTIINFIGVNLYVKFSKLIRKLRWNND